MKGNTNAVSNNTILTNSGQQSVGAGEAKFLTSVAITKSGKYLAIGRVQWLNSSTSGYYLLGFSTGTNAYSAEWFANIPVLNSDYQRITISRVYTLTAGTELKLAFFQNSGASGDIPGDMSVIWISD